MRQVAIEAVFAASSMPSKTDLISKPTIAEAFSKAGIGNEGLALKTKHPGKSAILPYANLGNIDDGKKMGETVLLSFHWDPSQRKGKESGGRNDGGNDARQIFRRIRSILSVPKPIRQD
jgi:hypothetical protein